LAITADGTAFVSCGALNAVEIIAGDRRIGMLPTGWYPDGVAVDRAGRSVYAIDGKGERSRPNPDFNPFAGRRSGYVAAGLVGSVRKLDVRGDAQTQAVLENMGRPPRAPADTVVRAGGPIRHVIYVIKENRSYDQVLGDIPGADGDPSLILFGKAVTPNQHAIAKRFGGFDRAFANAQVSADGHNWTDAAFANDYLERFWPQVYGGRRELYDFEDGADAATAHNGYLWDAAARARITYRNYGEFVTNPSSPGGAVTTKERNLKNHTSKSYPGFDLDFSDLDRFAIWLHDFRDDAKNATMPALEILRLPNDHTAGTKPGTLRPQAYVAQNDYALGRIVEAVSHSMFWKSTVIFSVEDDAQDGPDHVDDQRTTYYLATPYARGGVVHTQYSTASVVRTIEILLGLKPLSTYDGRAVPMYDAFAGKANLAPFSAIRPGIDLRGVNTKSAYGAAQSARMDFEHADAADPRALNAILYRSVREDRR
ncbi:MAG: alkaline phosphatase family protein, partial [Candidatus Eremiobacteraeota bacterium]|nr:alkaline phosphatase family protein [Candidatus Eremiobacteraeota bacterium]